MASVDTLTWEEFYKESLEFLDISQQLNDTWSWVVKNAQAAGQSFLKYTKKHTDATSQDLMQIEYHIVYSVAYQVPVLYFQVFTIDGRPMSLEKVWNLFENTNGVKHSREQLLSIVTQVDHPIFFRPFMCLHPCRTSDILSATPKSGNRLLTFISVMGPFLNLNLDNRYGLRYKDECSNT